MASLHLHETVEEQGSSGDMRAVWQDTSDGWMGKFLRYLDTTTETPHTGTFIGLLLRLFESGPKRLNRIHIGAEVVNFVNRVVTGAISCCMRSACACCNMPQDW